MSSTEKILIAELPDDAIWHRLRDKFREYDVENESEDENVYDLREGDDFLADEVFFWGRDGWSNGWWHAKVYLERSPNSGRLMVMALRGTDPDCLNLMATRKRLLLFMESCMDARGVKQDIPV